MKTMSALLVVAMLCQPVAAATAGAEASTATPELKAAVKRLLTITGSAKLGDQIRDQMMRQLGVSLSRLTSDRNKVNRMLEALDAKLRSRLTSEVVESASIDIYAKHLSLADIKALTAFYETPEGKHVIAAMPAIMSESVAKGGELGRRAAIDAIRDLARQYPESKALLPAKERASTPESGQ